jgi:lysozyme
MKIKINKQVFLTSLSTLDNESIEFEITNIEEILELLGKKETVTIEKPKIQTGNRWKISDQAIQLLGSPSIENTSCMVYPDSNGSPTIGIGHLLTDEEKHSGIININGENINYENGLTMQQVKDLCLQDLVRFENIVNRTIKIDLTQNQYDALVLFAFNIGTEGFRTSTLAVLLNQGNYDAVPTQMRRWNKETVNGVLRVNQGLINRREKEIKIWNGDYNV